MSYTAFLNLDANPVTISGIIPRKKFFGTSIVYKDERLYFIGTESTYGCPIGTALTEDEVRQLVQCLRMAGYLDQQT